MVHPTQTPHTEAALPSAFVLDHACKCRRTNRGSLSRQGQRDRIEDFENLQLEVSPQTYVCM